VCVCVAMFQTPSTEEEWNEVASDFLHRWNMPNSLGAMDGKLVHVQRPARCGGQYFNYKRTFSVNMMAVVNASYRFMYVAVGAQGSANDAAVFAESNFGKALASTSNPLSIPPARNIPGTTIETPLFFVDDEAYPLKPCIMKPFNARGLTTSERIFNYRLSRARRVAENAFGILSNRFRIFRTTMQLQPGVVCDVVMACCALHNYLRQKSHVGVNTEYDSSEETDGGLYIYTVNHEARVSGSKYNATAKTVRDKLVRHFLGTGQIPFQWKHANVYKN